MHLAQIYTRCLAKKVKIYRIDRFVIDFVTIFFVQFIHQGIFHIGNLYYKDRIV